MKIMLSGNERTILLVVSFTFIAIYSTLVLSVQYGSVPLQQLAVNGPLTVGEIEIQSNGEYQFQLMSGNQSIGSINTPRTVNTGEYVVIINNVDATNIPPFYTAREWQTVYVNDKLVVSGETKTLSYIASGLWGIPLIMLAAPKLRRKSK